MVRAFAAIRYIAAVCIGPRISALNITDTITGSPFANENAAIDMLGVEPGLKEMNDNRQLCPLPV